MAGVIANDDFNELVLKPIFIANDGVSDMSKLFMRGYQACQHVRQRAVGITEMDVKDRDVGADSSRCPFGTKIGKITQTFLREALESDKADDEEINLMKANNYSKSQFGIDFPLLVLASEECDSVRYYAKPPVIRGVQYRLCRIGLRFRRTKTGRFRCRGLKYTGRLI